MIQGADSRVGNRHSALPPSPLRARGAPPSPSPRQAHVDDPDLPLVDDAAEPSRTRPGLKRSLGVLKILVLGGGTLAIFAIAGFLGYIWKSAADAIVETSPSTSATIWKRLLDSGRLLQVITVSTVVLRFLAALQVGVMTQMLSSLVLERGGCSLKDLALLSLMRAETSGPFGEITFAIWRQHGLANRIFGALLFLLLIVSGVTQFSSTLLVADISTVKVLGNYNTSNSSLTLATREILGDKSGATNHWLGRAPAYPRFAEDPGSAVQGEDYFDTGTTVRAFLPLDSASQRTALRSYAGVTSAFDARVACVRPRLTVTDGNYSMDGLLLNGNFSFAVNYEGVKRYVPPSTALSRPVEDGQPFSCGFSEFPDASRVPQLGNPIFMCPISNQAGFIDGKMRPDLSYDPYLKDSLAGGSGADGYLLFNISTRLLNWTQHMTGPDILHKTLNETNPPLIESNSSGVWQSYRFGGSVVGADVTLCFTNPIDQSYQITADSSRDGQEPSPRWDINAEKNGNEAAREFLGATLQRRTPEDRGLLRLHPQTNWSSVSRMVNDYDTGLNTLWSYVRPTHSTSIALNSKISSSSLVIVPHRSHESLFDSVMAHTGNNVALALQALFTTLMQMAYYDTLGAVDPNITTTTLFSREVVIPRKWDGFFIFCGVFAAHLVLTFVVTALFLQETRISFLGNPWHAVAQVVAGAPDLDVSQLKDKTDDQVEEDLRRKPPVFIRSLAREQHKEGEEAEESGYEGSRDSSAGSLRRVPLERPPASLHSHVDGRAAQGGGEAERSVYGGPHRDNADSLRRVSLETSPARSYSHVGRRAAQGQGGDGSQWV
ncbi:hypothetical protein RB596_005970 [Gaeumannomyces avenae]